MNINEFAKKIGVSPTTVSSAVTGKGRISSATREMVLNKMRELGYAPNINARRLVNRRGYLVALSHVDQEVASDLFTIQVAREIVGALKSYGYDLWLNLAPDGMMEFGLLHQLVKSSTVDGTILIGGRDIPLQLVIELTATGHPCVVIGHSVVNGIPNVGSVVINLRPGIREAASFLVEQGHGRIGFIDSDLRDEVSTFFKEELAELGVQLPANYYIGAAGRDPEDGVKAVRELMSQPIPPTAIMVRTDLLAIGALAEIRRMGLSAPEDVSIIGHDDLSLFSIVEPGLTTIKIDYVELAKSAASLLHDLISNPGAETEAMVSDTALVVRQTAGPVSDRVGSYILI